MCRWPVAVTAAMLARCANVARHDGNACSMYLCVLSMCICDPVWSGEGVYSHASTTHIVCFACGSLVMMSFRVALCGLMCCVNAFANLHVNKRLLSRIYKIRSSALIRVLFLSRFMLLFTELRNGDQIPAYFAFGVGCVLPYFVLSLCMLPLSLLCNYVRHLRWLCLPPG